MQTPFNESAPSQAPTLLPLKELTEILIKHYDYREGFFEVGIQFNIAVGSVGPDPSQIAPGAVLTVAGVGLSNCHPSSPLGVNAAEVNPLLNSPKKAASSKKSAN
jgi:hypothetical protein